MSRAIRRKSLVVAVCTVVLGAGGLLSGCGSAPSGTVITVFAAASLKDSFTALGDRFAKDHPGSSVQFNFAGSSSLVTQLTQGAKADVFASADLANMDKAVKAGVVQGAPVNFASNTLVIVTRPGNPKQLTSFTDLARPGLNVVVCAAQVPCGSATQKVEKLVNTELTPVSEEMSVTDVLGKVTSGQADAGVVYRTDAKSAGDKVTEVQFPQASSVVNVYPIVVLKSTANTEAAGRFVALVTGEVGQQALTQAGFAKP